MMTKEKIIAGRLFGNFSYYADVVSQISCGKSDKWDAGQWETVRKIFVRFLDTGNKGILEDVKELEEIATRKANEK